MSVGRVGGVLEGSRWTGRCVDVARVVSNLPITIERYRVLLKIKNVWTPLYIDGTTLICIVWLHLQLLLLCLALNDTPSFLLIGDSKD